MIRYPHYWWPLKGQRFPSRIAILDCDSTPTPSERDNRVQGEEMSSWNLLVVNLRGGRPVRDIRAAGDSVASCWTALSHLLSSTDRTWMFCSPASRVLGLIQFWDRLEAGQCTLAGRDWRTTATDRTSGDSTDAGICILEDPPTVILAQIPGRPGKLLILDIRNWGIDILPSEISANERNDRYCAGICQCLHTLREGAKVSLRCTAASQAVSALRADRGCVRLHCHTNESALELERSAYYGGRCEAYRIGDVPGPVYHVDVRSMYPSIGLTLPIPVSLRRYHADGETARSHAGGGSCNMLCHVRIRSDMPTYPVRRGGHTVYPVGVYDTYLAGPELLRAVAGGAITRWYSGAEYTCAPLLAGFYGEWIGRQDAARAAGRLMEIRWTKAVMNGLVGKFGEPGRRWEAAPPRTDHGPYGVWTEDDEYGGETRWRNIAWHTQREEVAGESYWSMPAVAAWITAAGRVRLWDYIATAGRENVWYVDTDSLLCRQVGYDRLLRAGHIRDGETGYLRLLGTHSRCTIYGIRHYVLDDTVTCAGVPKGSIEPGETREQYFLRRQIAAEIAMGRAPRSERVELSYPPPEVYHHGVVHDDGRVTPLEIYDA
jgi:hypothetical protein